jgi:hypothetical protein
VSVASCQVEVPKVPTKTNNLKQTIYVQPGGELIVVRIRINNQSTADRRAYRRNDYK